MLFRNSCFFQIFLNLFFVLANPWRANLNLGLAAPFSLLFNPVLNRNPLEFFLGDAPTPFLLLFDYIFNRNPSESSLGATPPFLSLFIENLNRNPSETSLEGPPLFLNKNHRKKEEEASIERKPQEKRNT